MKKYLRLILEILLGVSLVAASTLAYMNYSAKKQLANEVVEEPRAQPRLFALHFHLTFRVMRRQYMRINKFVTHVELREFAGHRATPFPTWHLLQDSIQKGQNEFPRCRSPIRRALRVNLRVTKCRAILLR